MPAGRPSKYDPAYCEQVIEAGAEGYSLTAFAGKIGVNRDTLHEWASAHPEFSDAVKTHKAKRTVWWEDRLRSIAQNGGAGGAATVTIFGLKNVAPEEFADRVVNEHTGKDGGAIETRDLSATEAARTIAFALAKGAREAQQ